MESIKNIFIIGYGPSSSHTIGPYKACLSFIENNDFDFVEVYLYGSLALTGRGHLTDVIIKKALNSIPNEVIFVNKLDNLKHPNTLLCKGYKNNILIKEQEYYSLGGGKISKNLDKNYISEDVYPFNNFEEIKEYLKSNNLDLINFINKFENNDLDEYFENIFNKIIFEVENNLFKEGIIPGKLKLQRVSKKIYNDALKLNSEEEKKVMLVTSFAYACSEGNACGEEVVTAPTCGSCGVLPSICYYEYKYNKRDKKDIINALKIAGLIGNICKCNASISGAVHGCQAEIGVAASMASAALAYLNNLSLYQIEYAAEVALEHFLGLTCDPVMGYVQIPCIERNGIAAMRAYTSYFYAKNISIYRVNRVSLDDVVYTMRITGDSLNPDYKETSKGGLAKLFKETKV